MFGIVYTFCKVSFGSDKTYYYRTTIRNIQVGDRVIVPIGKVDARAIGTVIEITKCKRPDVPYPINKTKLIVKRAGKHAEAQVKLYNDLLIASIKNEQKKASIPKSKSDDLSWIDDIEAYDAFMDD